MAFITKAKILALANKIDFSQPQSLSNGNGKGFNKYALEMERTFTDQGIKYIRLVFVDTSNILRFRIVPITRFIAFFQPDLIVRGVFMATACLGLLSFEDHLVENLPPCIDVASEMCLVPEPKYWKLPYGSGSHAVCMGNFYEKDYVKGQPVPFQGCARTCLKNVVQSAAELGLSCLLGFESEVIFLKSTDPPTPIDSSTYCSSKAMHSIDTCKMLDEIVEALMALGLGVSQFHPESAPGQFEFVTDPYSPLEAADALILTRDTIFNIAAKYNLRATFAPKVFANYAGSASHCHISIIGSDKYNGLQKGPNCPEGLSALSERFMAGILKHLRGISAFTLPNVSSYDRVQDNQWAGVHVAWGIDNREATLRLAYTPGLDLSDRKFNFEIKCVDGTANPYFAVAAIMAAGMDGVKNDLPLNHKELRVAPSTLSKDELIELGITERLPSSVEEALDALKEDYEVFSSTMGKTMVDIFSTICAAESSHVSKLGKVERLKLVIETY